MAYSNELQVKTDTPPAILIHATNDRAVLAENSIMYYKALLEKTFLLPYIYGRMAVMDLDFTAKKGPSNLGQIRSSIGLSNVVFWNINQNANGLCFHRHHLQQLEIVSSFRPFSQAFSLQDCFFEIHPLPDCIADIRLHYPFQYLLLKTF